MSYRKSVHFCINLFASVNCLSNKVVLLMKIGYFKKLFFTNCDEMLNIVNFENGGTCVHRRILDVMLRILSNLLMSKLTDTSAYLGM